MTELLIGAKSMTLDDLEQLDVTVAEIKQFHGTPTIKISTKILIHTAAKCRAMIRVSINIRHMQIFTGVRRGEGVKCNK